MSELTAADIEVMMPAFLASLEAAKPAAIPLHKHGAFADLSAHLSFIQLGAEALKGLGAMFLPEGVEHQMNQAKCTDASAVFRFFGEALEGPSLAAYAAMETLQTAAEARLSIS